MGGKEGFKKEEFRRYIDTSIMAGIVCACACCATLKS